ncbi:MAG: hypothetical protein AAGD11_11300 [Planctomycetota bacterium]
MSESVTKLYQKKQAKNAIDTVINKGEGVQFTTLYGRVSQQLAGKGQEIPDLDTFVAAIAESGLEYVSPPGEYRVVADHQEC